MSCGIHLRAISHEILKRSILDMSLKINNLRLHPYLSGANELSHHLPPANHNYCQISNISHTLLSNKIVDHSDVVGVSPVGAAPTTSSCFT